jgi:ATP-dependent Clp protease ATP-binding subunit ClpA
MFDRFSERARKVMSLARQEAQRFNHDYIGTEHILLGLVQEGTGVAAQVLRNLEVEPRKIRMEVEKIVKNGTNLFTFGQLPFTPSAKRVLELSLEEAQKLAHNYIGTEHLLLGLIRERESIAGQVLVNVGARLEEVREEVLELLVADPMDHEQSPPTDRRPSVPWEASRFALRIAGQEATLRGHGFIGTEHLLLDVVLQPGPAADLLSVAGATADAVDGAITRLRADGSSAAPRGFTPSAKSAMLVAWEEARRRGKPTAVPAHVLFGLLSVPEGLAVTALTNLGVDIDALRADVSKLLDAG